MNWQQYNLLTAVSVKFDHDKPNQNLTVKCVYLQHIVWMSRLQTLIVNDIQGNQDCLTCAAVASGCDYITTLTCTGIGANIVITVISWTTWILG